MKIIYSNLAVEQLQNIKEYISKDNKDIAKNYLLKIKMKIEILSKFPYIGKINHTMNQENIRDYVVLGFKIIYQIETTNVIILAIYKYTNFDESSLY